MMVSKRIACTLVAALALTMSAAPAALAQPESRAGRPGGPAEPAAAPAAAADGRPGDSEADRPRPRFPMPGDRFLALVEQRIERVTARIEAAIERRQPPPKLAEEIRAELARGAQKLRHAAKKAAADGTVSRDEALEVRELAREIRQKAREKFGRRLRRAADRES